jgi:hypothetical protein
MAPDPLAFFPASPARLGLWGQRGLLARPGRQKQINCTWTPRALQHLGQLPRIALCVSLQARAEEAEEEAAEPCLQRMEEEGERLDKC